MQDLTPKKPSKRRLLKNINNVLHDIKDRSEIGQRENYLFLTREQGKDIKFFKQAVPWVLFFLMLHTVLTIILLLFLMATTSYPQ